MSMDKEFSSQFSVHFLISSVNKQHGSHSDNKHFNRQS